MTGDSIVYEAESDYSLSRQPASSADTVVSHFITVARTVVREIVEWLPWPLDKAVQLVTDIVFDVVEVFDFSETNDKVGGAGVQATDRISLLGDIFIRQDSGRQVTVDDDGSGGIVTSGDTGAQLVNGQVVVDDIVKDRKTNLSFLSPRAHPRATPPFISMPPFPR